MIQQCCRGGPVRVGGARLEQVGFGVEGGSWKETGMQVCRLARKRKAGAGERKVELQCVPDVYLAADAIWSTQQAPIWL